jgi:metallophosphoesterase (TIGR00282 family)
MSILKAVMIGDVVGEPGLGVLERKLPGLIGQHKADFVVVNGENAADGFGLTEASLGRIFSAGADVVTSGNHVWEKRDFWAVLDAEKRVLRPANYPDGSAGRGWVKIEKNCGASDISWFVINLQGRELMTPIDCPFKCFDAILEAAAGQPASIILVDFHAESTKEKEALAYYLDGRTSLVVGTHTHVQTADERILPKGTAYITDLGMTGIKDSVIGMDPKICLDRVRKQVLYRMEVAGSSGTGEQGAAGKGACIQGVVAEIDGDTGKALAIKSLI